jgi:6-phosphogluconolactonase
MGASHLIYLGTYTRTGVSKGIYSVRLDRETGAFGEPELAAEATDPAWITFSPDKRFLYAIHASPAQGIGFTIDSATGKLTPLPSASAPSGAAPVGPPSHLAVDGSGRVLLAANYHESFVAATAIRNDGTLGDAKIIRHEGNGTHPMRQEKPHVHSVTLSPDNRFVIVADLGLDRVFSYALNPSTASLTPAKPPYVETSAGAGPRHFKFGHDGRHAYVINELDSTIAVFDYDPQRGSLSAKQSISTLPLDYKGPNATAEIRVHPNGRFVYGSNRGDDSIAAFSVNVQTGELAFVEIVKTGGKSPRNFALSPDGRWLVCGHQDTPLLTVFRVDGATGRIARAASTANVTACVCVLFFD